MSDVPHYSPSTVEVMDLVARLVRGEEAGWVMFDDRFKAVVVSAARRNGVGEHDAEDLYQDLAVKLPGVLAQYTPEPTGGGGFRKWLGVVAARMALDFLRRPHQRAGRGPVADEVGTSGGIGTVVAAELDRRALAAAVDRLLVAHFQKPWVAPAWRLFWLDRLTPDEIVARLAPTHAGATYDAVARTLHRVKTYLAGNAEFDRLIQSYARPPE